MIRQRNRFLDVAACNPRRTTEREWHPFTPSHEHLATCEQCQEIHREVWDKHIGEPRDREADALAAWHAPSPQIDRR